MKEEKYKEILLLLSLGHTASEIGSKVGLKTRTVEKYLEILRVSYEAKNASHLVGIAFRKGLVK